MEIETINDSAVGIHDGDIVILNPKPRLNRQEALRLAGWIVVLADDQDEFAGMLEAVKNL